MIYNPDFVSYHQQDKLLASWLLSTVSGDLLSHFTSANTTHEVWSTTCYLFAATFSAKISQVYEGFSVAASNLNAFSPHGFSSQIHLSYGLFSHVLPAGPLSQASLMAQVNQVTYLPKSSGSMTYGPPTMFGSVALPYGPAFISSSALALPNSIGPCLSNIATAGTYLPDTAGLVNVSSNQPMAFLSTSTEMSVWYPDSGATIHVYHEASILSNTSEYSNKIPLLMSDGSCATIARLSHSAISTSRKLLHLIIVLHVPTIRKNLHSISQFAQDNNVFFLVSSILLSCKGYTYQRNFASRPHT